MSLFVSVIIPNYNHAEFLETRIKSVLSQTYDNFEVILLDDCSTDNSREVIQKYRNHKHVSKVIFNDTNSGNTFVQWELGISHAEGQYIWIAESDDYCEPTFLEELIGLISLNNTEIAFCQSTVFKDNEIIFTSRSDKLFHSYEGSEFISNRMSFQNSLFNASMVVFSKNLIKEESLYIAKNYSYCGDWFFWISILKGTKISESGKVLNYFRKHRSDVTSKSLLNGKSISEFIKIQDYLRQIGILSKERYYNNLFEKYIYFKKELAPTSANLNSLVHLLKLIPFFHRLRFSFRVQLRNVKLFILRW